VAGDKRHGRAVVQKLDGGGDLGGGGREFLGEDLGDVHGGPLDGCRLLLGVGYLKIIVLTA